MDINHNHLEYRKANLDDISELVKLKIYLLDELNPYEDKNRLDTLKTELEKFFIEHLETNEFISFLAEYKNEVISTSSLILWKIPPRYDCLHGRYGYISNMYTIPKFRRNGISTELLKILIAEAKRLSVDILNLHATKDGINMYRKFGFKEPIDIEIELNLNNF